MKKKILVFAAILTLSLGIMTACGSKDTNNSATSGSSSEPAATDEAGNVIDDTVDGAGDVVKGAGDAVKDATDDVTNGIEDATDDMTGNGNASENR